ncbi:MAG: peptidylprolyl isomerase [Gammaproteobacteria bacterium]|nr:peptidylprolyl isomerase [Gammaproteobacteria bacterium]NNF50170.1 peptidyl-prolyl cis-trans isomerase [Woeseiaceae bacterium]
MKKTLISLLFILPFAVACTAEEAPREDAAAETPKTLVTEGAAPAVAFVEVTTSAGSFTLRLDGRAAPLTVAHFLGNVNSGFYKGTVFHRIIPGFMIQGGGYDEEFNLRETDETIPNESGNGLANWRGTVAMARTPDPHSAGTQFFINVVDNVNDNPQTAALDPRKHPNTGGWGYAVFGYVVDGMDVVDLIAAYETDPNGPGGAPAPIIPVIIEGMQRVSPE